MEEKKITGFLATFLSLGISLLLIVAGAVLYWLYEQYAAKKEVAKTESPTPIIEVETTPSLPAPTPSIDPNEIQLLLVEEFPEKEDSLKVFVNRQSGQYATGAYQTDEPLESGWWLAQEKESGWQLIGFGGGNINCQTIAGHEVPLDLVPECYDQKTGRVIDRATEVTVISPPTEATQTP